MPETCPECGGTFKSRQSLGIHRWYQHGVKSKNSHKWRPTTVKRICRFCKKEFEVSTRNGRSSNNRQYCSFACARKAYYHYKKKWDADHPEKIQGYRSRHKDSPDRGVKIRMEKIEICGGKCAVCGIADPLFLQVHYKPGIEKYGWRHPRHLKWIKEHKDDFVVLCANHHQELTLTGGVRGWE